MLLVSTKRPGDEVRGNTYSLEKHRGLTCNSLSNSNGREPPLSLHRPEPTHCCGPQAGRHQHWAPDGTFTTAAHQNGLEGIKPSAAGCNPSLTEAMNRTEHRLLRGRCKDLSATPLVPWKSLSVQNCSIVPSPNSQRVIFLLSLLLTESQSLLNPPCSFKNSPIEFHWHLGKPVSARLITKGFRALTNIFPETTAKIYSWITAFCCRSSVKYTPNRNK